MSDRLPRKLAAILYADVAGYSRLTGEDEDGTHRALRTCLDLIASKIREHSGRVVHYAGDAVLADFGTVVDALSSATAIQLDLAEKNADVPEERRVEFRIGVNLGDVIVDGDEIYGDGVNVAARLESLAKPGGICISDAVRTAVGRKLGFHYEDMGAQEVKNIEEPVRSYHVRFAPGDERTSTDRPGTSPAAEIGVPTVVVLPFRFIGDPGEHDYIAAAMTESVGSALTHFRDYRIVEANEAGVATYALSGALQIAGPRIRISLQLSEGGDGRKLWAEKIDRKLDDVFELQDEISAIVAAYLGEAIWQETARKLAGKRKEEFSAIDWCYYAMEHLHRLTREGFIESEAASRKAMSLDHDLLFPKFLLAFTLAIKLGWGQVENADEGEVRNTVLILTEELLAKDPSNANAHRLAGRVYSNLGRHDEALAHSERAFALNPYDGDIIAMHGMTLMQAGRAQEAIPWVEKALRYNPQPPRYYRHLLFQVQYFAGDYQSALKNLRRMEGGLSPPNRLISIAALQVTGRADEAAAEVRALREEDSDACIQTARSVLAIYKDTSRIEAIEKALRDAGLPERQPS